MVQWIDLHSENMLHDVAVEVLRGIIGGTIVTMLYFIITSWVLPLPHIKLMYVFDIAAAGAVFSPAIKW